MLRGSHISSDGSSAICLEQWLSLTHSAESAMNNHRNSFNMHVKHTIHIYEYSLRRRTQTYRYPKIATAPCMRNTNKRHQIETYMQYYTCIMDLQPKCDLAGRHWKKCRGSLLACEACGSGTWGICIKFKNTLLAHSNLHILRIHGCASFVWHDVGVVMNACWEPDGPCLWLVRWGEPEERICIYAVRFQYSHGFRIHIFDYAFSDPHICDAVRLPVKAVATVEGSTIWIFDVSHSHHIIIRGLEKHCSTRCTAHAHARSVTIIIYNSMQNTDHRRAGQIQYKMPEINCLHYVARIHPNIQK